MQEHLGPKRFLFTTALLSSVVVAAFALASWSLYTSHQRATGQRSALCRAQNRTRSAVQSILDLAQAATAANPRLTRPQKLDAAAFYREARKKLRPIGC